MAENGFLLPVKFLRDLALIIMRWQALTFQIPTTNDNNIRPLEKNWPQAFYKRHLELKAIQIKALD
jgi:hypothetical protein